VTRTGAIPKLAADESAVAAMAARLRRLRFGICRILPEEKIPTYKRWTHASLEPLDFVGYRNPNLGIQAGAISGNLVIVDADKPAIRKAAAARLPRTMSDGRPSTGAAHWYYRVTDVPAWATAGPNVAGGLGGPKIMHFTDSEGLPIGLDFLGTGAQAVCPPSLHHSGERRQWLIEPEEILTLPFMELWPLAKALAQDHGAANADRETDLPKTIFTAPPVGSSPHTGKATNTGDVHARAIAWLAKCQSAVSGQGGHKQTFCSARAMAWGFDVGSDAAFELLQEHYNPRCLPPWTDAELIHKCEDADTLPYGKPRGYLLNASRNGHGTNGRHEGNSKPPDANNAADTDSDSTPGVHLTDRGNGVRLIKQFGNSLRHIWPWKKWLVWDGRRWCIDEVGAVQSCAKQTILDLFKWATAEMQSITKELEGDEGESEEDER
jgi:hypothetical protein